MPTTCLPRRLPLLPLTDRFSVLLWEKYSLASTFEVLSDVFSFQTCSLSLAETVLIPGGLQRGRWIIFADVFIKKSKKF